MAAAVESNRHDLQSLLSSPTRDFLVRNNGDQVLLFYYYYYCLIKQRV